MSFNQYVNNMALSESRKLKNQLFVDMRTTTPILQPMSTTSEALGPGTAVSNEDMWRNASGACSTGNAALDVICMLGILRPKKKNKSTF